MLYRSRENPHPPDVHYRMLKVTESKASLNMINILHRYYENKLSSHCFTFTEGKANGQ